MTLCDLKKKSTECFEKHPQSLLAAVIWVFLLLFFTLLLAFKWLESDAYATCIIVATLTAFAIFLHNQIAELQIGSFAITLRKKLDDANTLLIDMSKIILMQLYSISGAQSANHKSETEIRDLVFKKLKENNIDKEKIQELIDLEYPYVISRYYFTLNSICNTLASINEKLWSEMEQFVKISNNAFSSADYERIIQQLNIQNKFFLDRLEDLKYYEKYKDQRNPQMWADRWNWLEKADQEFWNSPQT